jgi:hypothetical protein
VNDSHRTGPGTTPERFALRPWADPLVEAHGFPVTSIYTETVLLPILGPTSVLCLRRLGSLAAARPDGTEVDTAQLARDLGLGDSLGPHSPITNTLGRLCGFDMARWSSASLQVRTAVPPVPERHLRRLSPELVRLHHCLLRQNTGVGVNATAARPGTAPRSTVAPPPGPEPFEATGSMSL